jgi:uncharacterized protein (TIRG00374 family)
MQKQIKNALFFLVAVFALLALLGYITNAAGALKRTDPVFLGVAAFFFTASIVIWLISWSYLIKNRSGVGMGKGLIVGFSAVYGSLTPVQLGAEMLRAVSLKERFNVPYSDSIAVSMVVKGIKFSLIALSSSAAILLFITVSPNAFVLTALLSGFLVVVLAAALFLLPLKRGFGAKIAALFGRIAVVVPPAAKLRVFFDGYSAYLSTLGRKSFFVVASLSAVSLFFEFLALLFSFYAVSFAVPLASVAVLFVLIAILERTPFLPRGIGVVEAAGFAFLSMPLAAPSLPVESIGALLIVFDFVRLVLPSLLSIGFYALFVSRGA